MNITEVTPLHKSNLLHILEADRFDQGSVTLTKCSLTAFTLAVRGIDFGMIQSTSEGWVGATHFGPIRSSDILPGTFISGALANPREAVRFVIDSLT